MVVQKHLFLNLQKDVPKPSKNQPAVFRFVGRILNREEPGVAASVIDVHDASFVHRSVESGVQPGVGLWCHLNLAFRLR